MNQATWDLMKPILAQALRDFLRTVGVALAARGFIQGDAGVTTFVGAGMALAGLFWGWFTTTGYLKVATLLKKLTDTKTQAAAVVVAKQMAPAAVSGIAVDAKADIAAVAKVLIAAFLLAALFAPSAFAQSGTLRPLKPVAAKTAASAPTTPAAPAVNPLQSFLDQVNKKAAAINAFTLADAQAAMTMAANDPVGLSCYTAIAAKLQANGAVSLIPQSLGLLQLIEAARLAKLQASAIATGVDPVVSGCAGLILDANTTLLMLEGQGAVGALTAVGLP